MSLVALTTVVLVGLLVLALAFYLLWVIALLAGIARTLTDISGAIRTIGDRTQPINGVMDEVNSSLVGVALTIEGLTAKKPTGAR